ncbi:glycosyltransferase family 4 protein [Synechococcus elongatus]|uniref:glycosyltransferase family 4 protein n=1 Tax=Synechococcus elongatus TaxID=32046 RepID=UPI0030D07D9F
MPNVLLVANTAWYLYNFRLPLIRYLQQQGFHVELVAPNDHYRSLLEAEGLTVHPWAVNRRSIDPRVESEALLDLIRIYRQVQPDLVHHFTIKACLYGTLAAKAAGIHHVLNAITGLGHVFLGERRRSRALRWVLKPIYRTIFTARRSVVVFQNAADQELLVSMGLIDLRKTLVIRGSGVDTRHFHPDHFPALTRTIPQMLFPSRLIREKGVRELLQAVQLLQKWGHQFELKIAGELDTGNRSALTAKELQQLQNSPGIACLGHVEDIRPILAAADIVVLPSYREGLSKALIEAAAMEKAIVTTDVPGCRDVVDHGRTGLLVPVKDTDSLARSLELLLLNPDLTERFGRAARAKVLQEFDADLVNARTVAQYRHMLSWKTSPSLPISA